MSNYETIIGLEIHVQLKTESKMFCSCDNESFTAQPNEHTCPVCMGHPGTLPVPNKQAVEWTVRAGLALNCKISEHSKFDRKQYYYPDLPKGYQVSQYDQPICQGGFAEIEVEGKLKKICLTRIHLEEDAGKLVHSADGEHSLVDLNRAGTPLMEIVTEPDIRSPKEASEFMRELRSIMRYLGVSNADMEKGHLRCDANISVRPKGQRELNAKVEMKNLNSFRNVEKALAYEQKRQTDILENGGEKIEQSTRGWDPDRGVTVEQRIKEEASDYRYLPEPDIPPLHFDSAYIKSVRDALLELPAAKRRRFSDEFGLPLQDITVLVRDKDLAEYFEAVASELLNWAKHERISDQERPQLFKLAANWILSELTKIVKKEKASWDNLKITPENMAELVTIIHKQVIGSSAGQEVLVDMFKTGADPSHVVEDKNLAQMSDSAELEDVICSIVKNNPVVVSDFKSGKANAMQFLIGQVMKETKGKANPQVAKDLLAKKLSS